MLNSGHDFTNEPRKKKKAKAGQALMPVRFCLSSFAGGKNFDTSQELAPQVTSEALGRRRDRDRVRRRHRNLRDRHHRRNLRDRHHPHRQLVQFVA